MENEEKIIKLLETILEEIKEQNKKIDNIKSNVGYIESMMENSEYI